MIPRIGSDYNYIDIEDRLQWIRNLIGEIEPDATTNDQMDEEIILYRSKGYQDISLPPWNMNTIKEELKERHNINFIQIIKEVSDINIMPDPINASGRIGNIYIKKDKDNFYSHIAFIDPE